MLIKSKLYELGITEMLMARQISDQRSKVLKPHSLSSIEWFVIGLIQSKSAAGGIRVTDIATLLNVQTTYITAAVTSLRQKKYISSIKDSEDARARLLVITSQGSTVVKAIETELQKVLESSLKGKITSQEFNNYFHVMREIAGVN